MLSTQAIMLTTDNNMRETERVILLEPVTGLEFQIAGALQRLGRKMLAIGAAPRSIAMESYTREQIANDKVTQFSIRQAAVWMWTDSAKLAYNQAFGSDGLKPFFELRSQLLNVHPELQCVVVVSASTPETELDCIRDTRTTILLSHAAYGLRDLGLLESTLQAINGSATSPHLPESIYLNFAGDIAANIVSIVQNPHGFSNKTIYMPPEKITRDEWKQLMRTHFSNQNTGLGDLMARGFHLIQDKLRTVFKTNDERYLSLHHVFAPRPGMTLSTELFPNFPSKATRALAQLGRVHRMDPELGLIFPPGRAP